MGNLYKFRLSDMIPNAWFYKLKDMNKTRKHCSATSKPANSHYLSTKPTTNPKVSDTCYPDPPRFSSTKRKTVYRPSPPNKQINFFGQFAAADIIIDMNKANTSESFTGKFEDLDVFDTIYEQELRPILTKPTTKCSCHIGKCSSSPKLSSKKSEAHARKSRRSLGIGESFAVVKSSVDPERDFRESMIEMIVENNLTSSKHLENLLGCYLSLNSNQYHHHIVKAFEQIWLQITDITM